MMLTLSTYIELDNGNIMLSSSKSIIISYAFKWFIVFLYVLVLKSLCEHLNAVDSRWLQSKQFPVSNLILISFRYFTYLQKVSLVSNESFIIKLMKKFITSNILGMDIRSFPWDLGALQNKIAGKLPFYL